MRLLKKNAHFFGLSHHDVPSFFSEHGCPVSDGNQSRYVPRVRDANGLVGVHAQLCVSVG